MVNIFYGLEVFYISGFFCSLIYIYFYNKYIKENKIELSLALKFSLLSYIFVLMIIFSQIETYIRKKKTFSNIKEDLISFYKKCDQRFMNIK